MGGLWHCFNHITRPMIFIPVFPVRLTSGGCTELMQAAYLGDTAKAPPGEVVVWRCDLYQLVIEYQK